MEMTRHQRFEAAPQRYNGHWACISQSIIDEAVGQRIRVGVSACLLSQLTPGTHSACEGSG